jgi:hypothetical protein
MILDMIQGCRYLRRSTDRLAPLEELDDSTKGLDFGTGPV